MDIIMLIATSVLSILIGLFGIKLMRVGNALAAAALGGVLGYLGADIVLDRDRGPMMLELNARPGLAIQIANGRGLANIIKEIENTYPKDLSWKERVDFVLGKH